jgi:hypothetical protein
MKVVKLTCYSNFRTLNRILLKTDGYFIYTGTWDTRVIGGINCPLCPYRSKMGVENQLSRSVS